MKDIFLVDADDTLLDFHGVAAEALRSTFTAFAIEWKEEYAKQFSEFNAGLWAALERKELTRDELMASRFCWFFEHIGLHEVDGKAFNQSFLNHIANNPRYIDGAQDFLEKLNQMGTVYIVTNGTLWIQELRFAHSKLLNYARDAFISDKIGCDKPSREYTEYVISHIDCFDKERAVWIGDSLSADIKGARDAGITSIWFNPSKKEAIGSWQPDYNASSFEEILDYLKNNS